MLSLACNVTPFVLPFEKALAVLQKKSEVILQKANLVKKGQLLLMVSGTTIVEGATNFLRVKKVGEV
jgi:pyruvate kinase